MILAANVIAWLRTRGVLVLLVALGLFAMGAHGVTDPDVWWHLRTGELIIQTHRVPHTDPFSFTRFGQPWVNHEWLSDVVIFSLYRLAGWGGLIVAFASVIAATLLLVFLRCPGHPFAAAIITLLGGVASAATWGVRPQMLSLLLASILLLLLEDADEHPQRVWWAVPLMLLWVNLHAGYAVGIVFLGLFLIGGILDVAFGFTPWPQTVRRLRKLGLVLGACLAVVPINPNGARMYWYPIQTLHSASMQNYIEEWLSPNFHELKYLPLLMMLLLLMTGLTLSSRNLCPRELLVLLATMFAALRSARHIPIFVLVAVPMLSGLVKHWLGEAGPNHLIGLRRSQPIRRAMLVNGLVLAAFATFAVVHVRSVIRQQLAAEAQSFPAAAAHFISTERPPGPILNYDNWGGYFIWRLYPKYRVYIDGRADLYGDSFLDDFAASYYLNRHWREPLRQWDIHTVILPWDAPLVTALRSTSGWRQIYADSQAVILTLGPTPSEVSQTENVR
jgi:hypothetical protein